MEFATLGRSVARKAARQAPTLRYYSIVHDVPRTTATSLSQTPPPPQPQSVFDRALNATGPRNDWTKEEISEIHQRPLMELAFAAVSPRARSCKITI